MRIIRKESFEIWLSKNQYEKLKSYAIAVNLHHADLLRSFINLKHPKKIFKNIYHNYPEKRIVIKITEKEKEKLSFAIQHYNVSVRDFFRAIINSME